MGEDVRTVEAVIKDDPECLAMFREAMKGEPGRNKETDNNVIRLDTPQGNSKAYSIDRVKRECEPEVVAKVMSGEMSPNAALVKAELVPKNNNAKKNSPQQKIVAVKKEVSSVSEDVRKQTKVTFSDL